MRKIVFLASVDFIDFLEENRHFAPFAHRALLFPKHSWERRSRLDLSLSLSLPLS